nr:hypothetical protein [Tanacetum cinerariifolium]
FPKHLTDLRDKFVDNAKRGGLITASHIKDILRKITVGDDESKLHFKKLMIYYLIEEVLLYGGNSKNPRKNVRRLVRNLKKCESVNWVKAIDDHLHLSMKYASQRKDVRDVLRALKATHVSNPE